MKNYYEILEVDKNASDQIIKVAYKSLVKKYHPDLKTGQEKLDAEKKIKAINEAYDVLSNPIQRAEYDEILSDQMVSIEEYNSLIDENNMLREKLSYYINGNTYNQKYTNNYSRAQKAKYTTTQTETNNDTKQKQKNLLDYMLDSFKPLIIVFIVLLSILLIIKIPTVKELLANSFNNGFLFFIIILIVAYIYFFQKKK